MSISAKKMILSNNEHIFCIKSMVLASAFPLPVIIVTPDFTSQQDDKKTFFFTNH